MTKCASKAVDAATLRLLFDYNAETGVLIHRPRSPGDFPSSGRISADVRCRQWNNMHAGKPAGRRTPNGYIKVSVGYKNAYAHRVAWIIATGGPPEFIDHINGDRADNRLTNLRDVTKAENARNAARRKDNASGCTGVSWHRQLGKWVAEINKDGDKIGLGLYHRLEDAVQARRDAESRLGFHENHGRG